MGFVITVRIATIATLVACAAPTAAARADTLDEQRMERYRHERRQERAARRFATPVADTAPAAWRIGQWVSYQRRRGGRVLQEQLTVIGEDGCGYWFEYAIRDRERDWSGQFCVSAHRRRARRDFTSGWGPSSNATTAASCSPATFARAHRVGRRTRGSCRSCTRRGPRARICHARTCPRRPGISSWPSSARRPPAT